MVRQRETVRRSDDARLAASEERFRAAFDALSDTLILFGPVLDDHGVFSDAEIGWINRSARERWFHGAPLQEMQGVRVFETYARVKPVFFDIYSEVVASGTDFRGVVTLSHSELGDRVLQLHVTPYEGGFIHSSRDITAEHRARVALEESESQLRAVSESLYLRVKELDSLQRISEMLAESLDPRGALRRVAAEVRGLLAARCARIHVLTGATDAAGQPRRTVSGSDGCAEFLDAEADLIHATLNGGGPVTTRPAGHVSDHHVAVPMVAGGHVVGVLIAGRETEAFSPREIGIAGTVADLLAAAVRNATMHDLEKRQAASDERQRLARDLHDAVSQSIYSAGLIAEALPAVFERSPADAEHDLGTLQHLVRSALAELRTLLYELRPASLEAASLATLLDRLGDSFTGRNDIQLEISVPEALMLPPDVKTAFYRVAQEALNNVAKHAKATVARVVVTLDENEARLTVTDDGIGIARDTDTAAGDSAEHSETYGLAIMRDRAKDVGASLTITGEPGAGTTVEMTWTPPHAGTAST
jgi:signal transduction histidine kinase